MAVEDRCAFPDGLSRRVDPRAVRDFARGGRGCRRAARSDVLRRDDGRSAQMWRASAKVACRCSSLVGTRHAREAKRIPHLQCRQASLALQMARLPGSGPDRRRCGDREADRVPFVSIEVGRATISPSKRGRMTKPAVSHFVAVLAVVATLIAPAVGAKEPSKGTSSITLPERPNEIPAFVAELDDKQARSTLVKVLEERTKPAEAEKLDLFTAAKRATSRISSRIDELAGARAETALSPVVFWRWLTSDGSDPGAPVRMLVTAFAVLAVCWAAQAAAAARLRRAFARRERSGLPPSAWSVELTLFVRWVVFLGVLFPLQALMPGAGKPPHQAGLALLLAFACAWITTGASTIMLPALHATHQPPSWARGRIGLLDIAVGLFFTCFFGVSLLREAGVSDDARLLIALPMWFAVGSFVIWSLPSSNRPAAANDTDNRSPLLDPIERYLALHSWTLLKLCGAALLLIAGAKAIATGPEALWQGIASFGLLAFSSRPSDRRAHLTPQRGPDPPRRR